MAAGELFDEDALGPPGAPSDRRPRPAEPVVMLDEEVEAGTSTSRQRGSGKKLTKKEQDLEDLSKELVAEARKAGAMLTPVLPTMGTYCFKESDAAMRALVDLSKDSPAAVQVLHTVAKAAPGITIGRFGAGLAISAMVDFRKVAPDAVAARALGVTEVWIKTHPKEASESGVYLPDPSPVKDGFPVL